MIRERDPSSIGDPVPGAPEPGVHRLRSRASTRAVSERLARAGWSVAVVDLREAEDKVAIMEAFSNALRLPGWFGRNWDALTDVLRDLDWWPPGQRGRVLVLRGAGRDTGSERDREILVEVLRDATDSWATTEAPLVVLLRR